MVEKRKGQFFEFSCLFSNVEIQRKMCSKKIKILCEYTDFTGYHRRLVNPTKSQIEIIECQKHLLYMYMFHGWLLWPQKQIEDKLFKIFE